MKSAISKYIKNAKSYVKCNFNINVNYNALYNYSREFTSIKSMQSQKA